MEITPHLSDREMAELLAAPPAGVDPHLEMCDSCLDEASRLREGLRGLRAEKQKAEEFWTRQRQAIGARVTSVESARPAGWRPLWLGVALACAALLAAVLLPRRAHAPTSAATVQTQAMQDHALLVEVEESLAQDGPDALQPAAILASEISPQDFAVASGDASSAQPSSTQPTSADQVRQNREKSNQ